MLQKIQENARQLLGSKTYNEANLTAELDKKAKTLGLNWKVSLVDFLKVLGADSSPAARDALANELGVSQDLDSGSAQKNEATRAALLKKLTETTASRLNPFASKDIDSHRSS